MTILLSKFLDAAATLAIGELKLAGNLSDQSKHASAHDHLVRYAAIQDVLTLGQDMLNRAVEAEFKKIREGVRS